MKYLGIDYGKKRIGLSVSDDEGKVAFPNTVMDNTPNVLSSLAELVDREKIERIVFGESKDFNMEDNSIMKEVKIFADQLTDKTGVEHVFHQEFLTSHQVSSETHHAYSKRDDKVVGEKQPADLDAKAATVILQSYIDTQYD